MANNSHILTPTWPWEFLVHAELQKLAQERFRGLLHVRYYGVCEAHEPVHEWEMEAADIDPECPEDKIGFLVWLHTSRRANQGRAIELRHPMNFWARHAQALVERTLAHRFQGLIVSEGIDDEARAPEPVDRCSKCRKAPEAHSVVRMPGLLSATGACDSYEPDTYANWVKRHPEERQEWLLAQAPKGLEDV